MDAPALTCAFLRNLTWTQPNESKFSWTVAVSHVRRRSRTRTLRTLKRTIGIPQVSGLSDLRLPATVRIRPGPAATGCATARSVATVVPRPAGAALSDPHAGGRKGRDGVPGEKQGVNAR